jgi:MFS transporter, FLVCR family, disrupted in renal carcinoma protein 2
VSAVVYFPSHPPSAPTKSAHAQQAAESRMTLRLFFAALLKLFQSRQFWILSICYGMTTGIYGSWGAVLSTNLVAINPRYSQSIAGWMGFSATVAGNIGGIVLGRIADKFHKMKTILVVFLFISALCFLAFTLLSTDHVHLSFEDQLPLLFVFSSLGGFFLNSTIPLFFEVSVMAKPESLRRKQSCLLHIFCVYFARPLPSARFRCLKG